MSTLMAVHSSRRLPYLVNRSHRRHPMVSKMAFLKTLVAMVVFCAITWLTASASEKAADTPKLLDQGEMHKLVMSLRTGDYALVRPSPSDETAEQQQHLCPGAIPSLVATLCDTKLDLKTRGRAAEILALCTTNNPENRQAIGTTVIGEGTKKVSTVHTGLIGLIRDARDLLDSNKLVRRDDQETKEAKIAVTTIGNAAEAIWILTFSNAINHRGFVAAGAIPTLASVTMDPECDNRNVCSRAVMWSAAALQNLAASYCSTDTGHCWWEWSEEEEEDAELRISDQSPVLVDGQGVREEILEYGNGSLVREIVQYVCSGPVKWPHHSHKEKDSLYAWPSRGEITSRSKGDEESLSIIPWAATGVIKNLALAGPKAREKLLEIERLEPCLCEHSRSPDWLEEAKAENALYFLGVEDCPPLYDEDCNNYEGWREEESGDTCGDYEENNWCVEYGHLKNEQGQTAKEACCACGGGTQGLATEL